MLKLAAEKAGWTGGAAGGEVPAALPCTKSFHSFVAHVAEVSMSKGKAKVERIVCAVDCGVAVNPDIIKAQMEGGIGYGLGAAMRDAITLTGGVVTGSE